MKGKREMRRGKGVGGGEKVGRRRGRGGGGAHFLGMDILDQIDERAGSSEWVRRHADLVGSTGPPADAGLCLRG